MVPLAATPTRSGFPSRSRMSLMPAPSTPGLAGPLFRGFITAGSVLMAAIEETSLFSIPSSTFTENDVGEPINDEFRSLLAGLAEARARAEARSEHTAERESAYSRMSSSISEITGNIEGFFDPGLNLFARLNQTARLFSETTGARTQLLDTLRDLSSTVPTLAAGLIKDLFAMQSAFTNALQNTRTSSVSVIYAKVAYMQLSFLGQMSSYLNSLSGSTYQSSVTTGAASSYFENGTTRFGQMSLQLQFQQVSALKEVSDTSSFDFSLMMKGSYFGADLLLAAMDPLVLDLDGDGIDLKPVEDGVLFDLTGDGREVKCGFVTGDDALLFLDDNGDGVCTSGLELFGNQQGNANGFAKLAEHDENADGEINSNDNVYNDLRVWNDANNDGVCSKNEVRSLQEVGVASVGVTYQNTSYYSGGNEIAQSGFFRTFEGKLRSAVDANFNYYLRA